MDVIFSLGHFCELEGPSIIFCTQKLFRSELDDQFDMPSEARSSTVPENNVESEVRESSEDPMLSSTESLFKSDTEDSNQRQSKATDSPHIPSAGLTSSCRQSPVARKSACVTCSIVLPCEYVLPDVPPRLISLSTKNPDIVYISSQYPRNQNRYSVLRRLMVRCLSCEYSVSSDISESMSNPLFFGDQENGYVIAQSFSLHDSHARGGLRRYAFVALSKSDHELINRYSFIVEKFSQMVQFLRLSSTKTTANYPMYHKKTPSVNGTFASPTSNASSLSSSSNVPGQTPYGMSPSNGTAPSTYLLSQRLPSFSFLRRRDGVGEGRNLADITCWDGVFIGIHSSFSWILDIWDRIDLTC
ncbi:vesicle coat protein [Schizosaccharomyces octosporus yFS286]|uniref:Vesicle coat protein n=1 Tax=Schizosaccharomyces octosporus (strain yFS286) TaxID=483514 RepID=S9PX20_SCHOY|nr:vesicle coat protein [Schizosaccharomyces octosporus yFS286]EPX72537.1 vesicle coat protein [Schizosaccharomyces octosporus yFS286]